MKAGILGGGQLGRMLLQAAANYDIETFVLENDADCPAAHLCHHFVLGDITAYDDVYAFGKGLDVLTIEIEKVNTDALIQLEKEGVKVFPRPAAINIINNKITQKQLYKEHSIPSPNFVVTQSKEELMNHKDLLPAVHKAGKGGYDGRGVQLLKTIDDFNLAFDVPSVLEKMVNIDKEIAIIVAVGTDGKNAVYPPAEMIVDPTLNLLDYQLSPARIPQKVLWKAEALAVAVLKHLNSPGLFAVELFVDRNQDVWVNETAPRVHNSGHHTIEANYCSQYDMLWRIMLEYPLGNTAAIMPSAIVNMIGEEHYKGIPFYEGLHDVLKLPNAFVHIYGKHETKPGRKMGHVTVISNDYSDLTYNAHKIKNMLKIKSR